MTITCPVCERRLPGTEPDAPSPRRGDALECGMCGADFRLGPPHTPLPRMSLVVPESGDVRVQLREGHAVLVWIISPAKAREFAAGVLEAAALGEAKIRAAQSGVAQGEGPRRFRRRGRSHGAK